MLTHYLVAQDRDYKNAVSRVSEMYRNWSHAKEIAHQNLTFTTASNGDYVAVIWIVYTED